MSSIGAFGTAERINRTLVNIADKEKMTMRVQVTDSSVKLWLSASDTAKWARNWPCSQLAWRRVFAEFDSNGLVDVAIDGKDADVDSNEFSACTSDHLAQSKLPKDHVAYWVACGQFLPVTA